MPKSRIVVTNPVDKIDAERLKNLIAEGNNRGKPSIEDKKDGKGKVKRKKKKDGTGSGGDNNPDPNNTDIKPEDLFWNSLDFSANPNTLFWNAPLAEGNTNLAPNTRGKDRGKKSKNVVSIPLTNRKVTDVGDPDYARFAADMIRASNSYTKTKDGTLAPATNDNDMYNIMINRRLRPLDVQKFLIRQAKAISDNDMESKFAKPSLGVVSNKYSDAAANLQNEVVRFQTELDKNKAAYKRSKASDFIETRYTSENGVPKLFWGALIGAGINMASSLIGGISAKKQAAEQAKIAEQQRLKAEAEANLASDQVQLKSYVPSNNPGYFAAGGTVENNSFTPNQYGVNISPNAQFLTNADGSTYGDHSTGNEVPIYNKDKKLIALAHPREILYTKPDGDQVVLSEARGYSTAYNNLQNMINERKVKLFKTRKDPKGDISRDIQDLIKAQVGLVAKQEEDSANPNQMKCGGRVRRKAYGGNVEGDDEILNRFANNQSEYAPVAKPISTNTFDFNNLPYPTYIPSANGSNPINKNPIITPDVAPEAAKYSGPAIKPTITFEQTLSDSDLTPRKIDPNPVQTWLNKQPVSTWDKIKGVIKDPAVQNASINTLGNLASNIVTNSYLSAADKTVSSMKPVHVRYAPINERVDTSGQEASAQNAYNTARSEINNVSDPTRRSALLNDLTGRYVSNTNEIAGNRINAEISKQNANITAANQVSAQNAAAENAMNQYKTEAKAGILGAKSTNMGSMMTKIMQGIQDYRLGQNDKAKLDMVLQRFKSGVADRMDYDALENIFGIIKGANKDSK